MCRCSVSGENRGVQNKVEIFFFFRALSASISQTRKRKLHGAGRRPKLGTSAAHPYGISTSEQEWIKSKI